jgi:preprotein translocase subunit SecE
MPCERPCATGVVATIHLMNERRPVANPVHDTEGVARSQPGHGQPARPATFVAQVMAELRKVVQPTRQELITYTVVVLVFVAAVMGFVFGLDQLFRWVMGLVFGS